MGTRPPIIIALHKILRAWWDPFKHPTAAVAGAWLLDEYAHSRSLRAPRACHAWAATREKPRIRRGRLSTGRLAASTGKKWRVETCAYSIEDLQASAERPLQET